MLGRDNACLFFIYPNRKSYGSDSDALSNVRSYVAAQVRSLISVELFGKILQVHVHDLLNVIITWTLSLCSFKYLWFTLFTSRCNILIWFGIKQKQSKHVAEFMNINDSCEAIGMCDNFHVFLKTNPGFANAVEISGCHLPFIVITSLPYKNDNKYLPFS